MKKTRSSKPMSIHRELKPQDWIEIRYQGRLFLVAISTLLNAYKRIAELEGDYERGFMDGHACAYHDGTQCLARTQRR